MEQVGKRVVVVLEVEVRSPTSVCRPGCRIACGQRERRAKDAGATATIATTTTLAATTLISDATA
jgi:hypothetical protein